MFNECTLFDVYIYFVRLRAVLRHGYVLDASRALLKANVRYDSSRYQEKNEKAHKKKAWSMRKKDLEIHSLVPTYACAIPVHTSTGTGNAAGMRGDLSGENSFCTFVDAESL